MKRMSDLGKCTMRGCPVRWRDGIDRPCIEHLPGPGADSVGNDWLNVPMPAPMPAPIHLSDPFWQDQPPAGPPA
jgi:hypothetical protein